MSSLSDMSGDELEAFINSGGDATKLLSEGLGRDPIALPSHPVEPAPLTSIVEPVVVEEEKPDSDVEPPSELPPDNDTFVAGRDDNDPEPDGGYKVLLQFANPAIFLAFFDKSVADGHVKLWPWQREVNIELAPTVAPTSQKPLKYFLVAANGSGKDAFVIAPFAAWFIFCKVRSRVIITSSSGGQLTSQTETYIKNLCEKVNLFFGATVFRIRQRYIKCLATGSEIRMFATDEAGKAEGYHPIEPNAEMAIIKNESKSIDETIHKALKRCTGYNYWLEISSPGIPRGAFHWAVTNWNRGRKITSFDCPHISDDEREADKIELGESSAEYRSKHLAEFTSTDTDVVIPIDVITTSLKNPPIDDVLMETRIGIDLAAGGDETCLCRRDGNKKFTEKWFREKDTVVEAQIIDRWLKDQGIPKNHPFIYADDGGIGHAIIDMLVTMKWKINRVLNQSAAKNKKRYGNRGAEMWFAVKRVLEEGIIDVSKLSQKTLDQLGTRKYKQVEGGRMFLQSKRQAKAEGFASPDRADAFILTFCGQNILDFVDATVKVETQKHTIKLLTPDAVAEYYEDANFGDVEKHTPPRKKSRSLLTTINRLINK